MDKLFDPPFETPFETGPERYQPPANYPYARDPKLRFDQRRLARVVGFFQVVQEEADLDIVLMDEVEAV